MNRTHPKNLTARTAAILLAACGLMVGVLPAAAQLGQVNLQFEDSEGPTDATIIVPVQIVSLTGASTVFFRVDTDGASLELTDVLPGQSAAAAGKGVSIGMDMQNRPTVLVTDFGGGMQTIPNGDLVFLIFRSAPALAVGTDIPVTGADASAASPSGSMLLTSAFGAVVEIVACTAPDRPLFLAASDGSLDDRVALGWLPAAGASEYRIYRADSNNFGAADWIDTVETTQYDDTTAAAATQSAGGCQGQALPFVVAQYYWIVASNACGQSAPSPVDPGFRGLASANRVDAPLQASATPLFGFAVVAGFAWIRRRRPAA